MICILYVGAVERCTHQPKISFFHGTIDCCPGKKLETTEYTEYRVAILSASDITAFDFEREITVSNFGRFIKKCSDDLIATVYNKESFRVHKRHLLFDEESGSIQTENSIAYNINSRECGECEGFECKNRRLL